MLIDFKSRALRNWECVVLQDWSTEELTSQIQLCKCLQSCDVCLTFVSTCLFSGCTALPELTYGTITLTTGNLYQSVASFSCDNGFTLSATGTQTCLADGSWSSSSPTCDRNSKHLQPLKWSFSLIIITELKCWEAAGPRLNRILHSSNMLIVL